MSIEFEFWWENINGHHGAVNNIRLRKYVHGARFLCFWSGIDRFVLPGNVQDYLTHWPLDKMATISQTTIFKYILLNEKNCIRFEFYWSLLPKGPIDNKSALVQVMVGAEQAASHYLNQRWPSSLRQTGNMYDYPSTCQVTLKDTDKRIT